MDHSFRAQPAQPSLAGIMDVGVSVNFCPSFRNVEEGNGDGYSFSSSISSSNIGISSSSSSTISSCNTEPSLQKVMAKVKLNQDQNENDPDKKNHSKDRYSGIHENEKESEIELMKEKFAKLLLGEDMSGGGKGVCSALAISNAITNLSVSVFGEIWRLEPLCVERKALWKREMNWLLSIADHIVELVPSLQTFEDGSTFEVMVNRPRADILVNIPALRKLDAMLLESLDRFSKAEFWYIEQGSTGEEDAGLQRHRDEEKWWLPMAKVPRAGLSEVERKRLQHQKDCVNQILKAALAINSQVLSEMEIPDVYWTALPKTGKASLGESLYKDITSEWFSPEVFLSTSDLSSEHKVIDLANRLEAAVHVWRRRNPSKPAQKTHQSTKQSWGKVKDFVSDGMRRDLLTDRAESALVCLKQRFPHLRQSCLDVTKIQYNKDVGQSILESYSRVLESLASNIIARIDDVLYVDEMTKQAISEALPSMRMPSPSRRQEKSFKYSVNRSLYGTPFETPSVSRSPSPSSRRASCSPTHGNHNMHALSEFIYSDYELERGFKCDKKPAMAQLTKSGLLSRSMNSTCRSQLIYPLYEE